MKSKWFFLCLLFVMILPSPAQDGNFRNFKVAVYCRAYEVEKMADMEWLEPLWEDLSREVHVDKIYLETHRDLLIVKEETLRKAIKFFKDKGLEVAGGITYTVNE
jgi:hypothetical protein